jgi:hypothetical protein
VSTVRSGATAGRYVGDWGSLEISDPASARRSGFTHHRLEVYPPGTDSIERRQLQRFRLWRVWGALAAIVAVVIVGSAWHGWQAPLFIAVVYLAGLMLGAHANKRLRQGIHTLNVATILVGGTTHVEGDIGLLESCVVELEQLDRRRAEGQIGPVEYERVWTKIYLRLEPGARQHTRVHNSEQSPTVD